MQATRARRILRLSGFGLLIPAIALLVRDLALRADFGLFEPVSLAQYWQDWWPGSFERARGLVQQHISWRLWDLVMAPMLQLPAFVLIGGAGLVLLLASHRLRPRRRQRAGPAGRRGTPSRAMPRA